MPGTYLIISPENLKNSISALIEQKRSRGYNVRICSVEEFGRISILSKKRDRIAADWIGFDWINHYGYAGANGWHIRSRDIFLKLRVNDEGVQKHIFAVVSHRVGNGNKYIGLLEKMNGKLVSVQGSIACNWVNHPDGHGNTGWHLRNNDRYFVGDFDGDGNDEIFVVSPRGRGGNIYIGLLRKQNEKLVAVNGSIAVNWVRHPAGSSGSGWQLRFGDKFIVGDFDGDGRDEIAAISPTGRSGNIYLGLFCQRNGKIMAENGSIVRNWVTHPGSHANSGWRLGAYDKFHVANLDGGPNGKDNLIVVSRRIGGGNKYIGILKKQGNRFYAVHSSISNNYVNHPGGRGATGWHLRNGDTYLIGDFNGDGKEEIVIISPKPSGGNKYIGIIRKDGSKLVAVPGSITSNWVNHPGGRGQTGWHLNNGDRYWVGRLNSHYKDDVLIMNSNGQWIGILKMTNNRIKAGWIGHNKIKLAGAASEAGWILDRGNQFILADLNGDGKDEIVGINPEKISCESLRQNILGVRPACLLLVGDANKTPGYTFQRRWYDHKSKMNKSYRYLSDCYFVMRPNEVYPQIPVGRLSTNKAATLRRICSRLINYPQNTSRSWRKRVILSGFLPRKNRSEDANDAGWRCKDEIGSFFEIKMEYENITSIPLTRRQLWGADNSSLQSFIETINNGSLILQYYGHGTYASWDNIGKDDRPPETATNESFGNYHLARKISLTDKLPLVISAACNTGQIKQSPSLAELWMTELKSIGIFAADHISSDHWNARIVPRVHEQIVTLGKRRVGDILVGAMKKLNDDFSFGAFGKHTFRMYRYLGDPDTILKIPD